MGKFFYLTRRPPRPLPRHTPRRPRLAHPRRWCGISLALLVVACLLYLVQVNDLATKGYLVEALRQQASALRLESRELESQASQRQSLQHLKGRIQGMNLVPAGQVRYVAGDQGVVSLRLEPAVTP